ncbi:hypothetical protein EGH24_00595 [Halonotius terrestris]|uniref:DUF7124 domain-containing protein n=1 Tax=Halonotius terrestris TaxID=2487750 RepID=A0A8J8TDM4_9EURY|nr:hypothetical protein [Halonotius terrestris]TQQ83334.1 hypothetical protein EGH24_00595 [Halonotius terrestris]
MNSDTEDGMTDDSDTEAGTVTLAFSLSAIERLDDPAAVFADAENWSRSIGIIDDDTDRIKQVVAEYDLRQDFDMEGRDKWFVLEELCETESTPRHVYVGASDADMRVSTLFCWEYVRVAEAAEKSDWALAEPRSERGIVGRVLAAVRALFE